MLGPRLMVYNLLHRRRPPCRAHLGSHLGGSSSSRPEHGGQGSVGMYDERSVFYCRRCDSRYSSTRCVDGGGHRGIAAAGFASIKQLLLLLLPLLQAAGCTLPQLPRSSVFFVNEVWSGGRDMLDKKKSSDLSRNIKDGQFGELTRKLGT